MLGRHLYLSLSWQVVPWESDGEGAYGRQPPAMHIATDRGPDMHSDLGSEHACGPMIIRIMAPMPSLS